MSLGSAFSFIQYFNICKYFCTGPRCKYRPREIQPTLYFVLRPPHFFLFLACRILALISKELEELYTFTHMFLPPAQPPGQPEIGRMSLHMSPPEGGEDLFIIGKNFTKNTHVIFKGIEDTPTVWSEEVDIDHEFFQPVRLFCCLLGLWASCRNPSHSKY